MTKDLSRKVAEVMGWTHNDIQTHWWHHPEKKSRHHLPNYANNLNLAMEFAAKACEKLGDNVNFTIWYDRRTGDTCISFWESGGGYIDHGSEHVQGLSPSDLAAAICKAGLRALRKE